MAIEQTPEPSERIQLPAPSWGPVFLAVGIAVAVVGTFTGWPYLAAGAVFALAGLSIWATRAGFEISRLPRHQETTTAVIPPVPVRRPGG